jgi:hypothetical protein
MSLFSAYDKAAGHVRRYASEELIALVTACGLKVTAWTYWGSPLLPLLAIRQRRLKKMVNEDQILRDGFAARGQLANAALLTLSRCERIPQHNTGTSLMLIAHRECDDVSESEFHWQTLMKWRGGDEEAESGKHVVAGEGVALCLDADAPEALQLQRTD